MGSHATLGPSSAARWIACPGSIRLLETVPSIDSDYAAEGTFAHELAAQCLEEGWEASETIGTCSVDLKFKCDEEMAGHIQTYLDIVRGLMGPDSILLVEQRVEINDDVWGTADALVYTPAYEYEPRGDGLRRWEAGHLHVVDFKYGAGVFTPVESNPQLGCYALGAVYQFSDRWQDIAEVSIHIVQPRHHLGGHHVETVPIEALETWGRVTLDPAVAATKAPDAPLAAGDHCRFCDAKSVCPALKSSALAATREVFNDDLTIVESPRAVASLTPVEIQRALAAFPVVEQWMKAVRESAYHIAATGGNIPGHKLVAKSGNRKWNDPSTVEFVLDLYDVDPFTTPKLVTPAVAEKLVPRDAQALVKTLAYKPSAGTVLVPDSDKRIAHNAADVFDDSDDLLS